MERKQSRKKLAFFIMVILLASAITVGLIVGYHLYSKPDSINSQTSSGWATEQFSYAGISSVGTFVQVTDQEFSGFVIAGTTANGSILVVHTRQSLNETLMWQKIYGNGSGSAIASTENDGFIVAGVKFLSTSSGPKNVSLLIRTDSEGNTLWSKTYDGNGFYAVVNASDGGYVALGRFNINGAELPGLIKIDSSGNVIWTKTYTSSESDVLKLYTLIPTADGGYGLVGEMQYTINGNVMRNGWFVKTDANGDTQVNRPFSMNGACVLYSVVQEDDGGYVLVGATANSISDVYSAILIRTDYDGHSQWFRIKATLDGTGDGQGFQYYSATKAQNGILFVSGYLNGVGSTFEAINATGQTDHYELKPINSDINNIIPSSTNGYALAGYKDGKLWLLEKYLSTIAFGAIP